jgi:FkbM family methyltransferase
MINHYHAGQLMFYVRPRSSDMNIIDEVVLGNCYLKHYDIKGHDVVIDIGAHIGSFSILAASKGAAVHSFEPVQRTYDLLVKNIELNELAVKAYRYGVMGKEEQDKKIYIRAFNYGGSNFYVPHQDPKWKEIVDVVTLDWIVQHEGLDEIDFLKLDCEGAELEILESFSDLRRIKNMALEYHIGERRDKIKELLKNTHKIIAQPEPTVDAHKDIFGLLYAKRI